VITNSEAMTTDNGTRNLYQQKGKQRKNEGGHRGYGNRAEIIKYFYRYSDYSTHAIAEHLSMSVVKVQKIVDELIKSDALEAFIEESTTRVEKIMSEDVISLDYSNSVVDAAAMMAKYEIGSIIVTKRNDNGKSNKSKRSSSDVDWPYGIVTERDIVRRLDPVHVGSDFYFQNALLGHICSHPLISAYRGLTVYDATEIMIKNRIRRLPILSSTGNKIIGIVTTTDLAMFLSPSKRPGLVSSLLRAIARGTKAAKKETRQRRKLLKQTYSSVEDMKIYICRTCFKKFDQVERMGKHVMSEHRIISNSQRDMRTPLFVEILSLCVNGATKSHILKETSPLTHEQLRRITAELVDKKLIRYVDGKRIYITTDKGHQFLNQNRKL
jgi:CBS domain-containing protein/predicted transcriptional regulator